MSIECQNNLLEKKERVPGRKIKKIYYLLAIVGIVLSIISIISLSKYYIIFGGAFKIG